MRHSEATSSQKRAVKASHKFACDPHVFPLKDWTILAFVIFIYWPKGWKAELAQHPNASDTADERSPHSASGQGT